jgi:beta-lactam-binding protein with PASTA domain
VSGRGGRRLRDAAPGTRARALAVALTVLALVAGVRPALPQDDPAAIKAALDRVQAEVRTVEGELRQAVARARAIRPATPLADREAIARRIVELRQRLDRLKADLEAERQRIATVPDAGGLVAVADVVGLPAGQAERVLRAAGLVPATRGSGAGPAGGSRGGSSGLSDQCVDPRGRALRPDRGGVNTCPAPLVPSEWLGAGESGAQGTGTPAGGTGAPAAGTVQSQAPAAGNRVPRGTTVTLVVGASPPTAARTVPDVRGLDHAEATARLQAAGLGADFVGGDPPRSAAEEHKVQWTRPAAGDPVAPGSRVEVAIRPEYRAPATTVPDVRGLDHAQAAARLQAAGLGADFVGGDPPRSAAEEHKVQWTRPAAGNPVAPGSRVEVAIRPEYREPVASVPRIPPERVPVAPPDPGPAPSREVLSGPVTCPPMPGPRGAIQGRLDRSRSRQSNAAAVQEVWCEYWGHGAGFSYRVVDAAWVRAGAQARWEHCGKEGRSGFVDRPLTVGGTSSYHDRFYVVYGRSGMASAAVFTGSYPVENLNPAVLRALTEFLVRELEPRAAPCSGAPAAAAPGGPPPPDVQRQPSPPPRGGVRPVPSWPPLRDPCPGTRPLGQSDRCE